jgi:hypothetical protein
MIDLLIHHVHFKEGLSPHTSQPQVLSTYTPLYSLHKPNYLVKNKYQCMGENHAAITINYNTFIENICLQ